MKQYRQLAKFYDLTYEGKGKDYVAEAMRINELAERFKKSPGNKLLDVACGTGKHLAHLGAYQRVGLDINEGVLSEARKRLKGVRLVQADMTDFSLKQRFDVLTCMFSSIGYVRTLPRLRAACKRFSEHLNPGGVAIIEPWITPESFKQGHVTPIFLQKDDLFIARMSTTKRKGRDSFVIFHWLIGEEGEGVEYVKDEQVLGLFTKQEMTGALEDAGFRVKHYKKGFGRGLFVAVKK